MGSTVTEELKPSGKDQPVTQYNKHEYVDVTIIIIAVEKSISAFCSAQAGNRSRRSHPAGGELLR